VDKSLKGETLGNMVRISAEHVARAALEMTKETK
jgi:hypothetical protein